MTTKMSVKVSTCILLVSLFLVLQTILTSSRCPDSQKSSLLSFKNDLIFDSKVSTKLVHWNESIDCCDWWGVVCDEAGHMTTLGLGGEGISGGITSSHLKSFKNLESLGFSYNRLSGNFPEFLLTSFPSLVALYLRNNNFTGPISNDIRLASYKLIDLDLSYNRFQGPLPEFIFKLPSISNLILSGNNFSGSVRLDMFGMSRNLFKLDLSYNNLTVIANTKESSSFSSLAKLDTLRLVSCKMLEVPNLKKQVSLWTLDLSDNLIKGEIPNWIWNVGNGSLGFVNLSRNEFSSLQKPYTFPKELSYLDLSSNKLKGDIPVPPPYIYILDYSNNKFGSSIPADFGDALTFTYSFSISHSKVVGIIPKSINKARALTFLDLSRNLLTGRIPLDGSTLSLESLDLSVNKLSGRIPEQLSNMELKFLNVSDNRLTGKIPQWGVQFTNLSFEGNKGLCGPPLSKTC